MKRALIISPFSEEKELDVAYAREAMRWCLESEMAPFVGQLLYGEVLDDRVPGDRKMRFNANEEYIKEADVVTVFVDRGLSSEMEADIEKAMSHSARVEIISLKSEIGPVRVAFDDKSYPDLCDELQSLKADVSGSQVVSLQTAQFSQQEAIL